jgi:hypothetical protein
MKQATSTQFATSFEMKNEYEPTTEYEYGAHSNYIEGA